MGPVPLSGKKKAVSWIIIIIVVILKCNPISVNQIIEQNLSNLSLSTKVDLFLQVIIIHQHHLNHSHHPHLHQFVCPISLTHYFNRTVITCGDQSQLPIQK